MPNRALRWGLVAGGGLALAAVVAARPRSAAEPPRPGVFLAAPYVQLGDAPAGGPLSLLWHADDVQADWAVEVRGAAGWAGVAPPAYRRINVDKVEPHRVYRAILSGPAPGEAFDYRVSRAGKPVFEARSRARKPAGSPRRVLVFGDCAADTVAQRAIADRAYSLAPDLVVVPGDVVYSVGRITEYRNHFFPVYNADAAGPKVGAPLLRSVPLLAILGNHDIQARKLDAVPDGLAYFYYWDHPRNGVPRAPDGPGTLPIVGSDARRRAFFDGAGPNFPGLGSFSLDDGDAHWTVLDSNYYTDWTEPALREWIARDLLAAKSKRWRFVAFHHPGFNSSRAHFDDQRARLLAPLFEAGKVDVVFSGHVHNYQRSYPLRFRPTADAVGRNDHVDGTWTLDRAFDGTPKTRPEGVIYLVTGAGGAKLYDPGQQDEPKSWQAFTHKFVSGVNSLTVMDLSGPDLSIRQVAADGQELDRFALRSTAP